MMNYIWSGLFLVSFFYAVCRGSLPAFGSAIVESSQSAVTFVIGLTGIMAMWSGLMEVAERTGLIRGLARLLMPFTRLLFPGQKDSETLSCIIMSFMANIFGAGNSSTVFALRAMERLDAQNNHASSASNDMCTFAVVNIRAAGSRRHHSDSRGSRFRCALLHRSARDHHREHDRTHFYRDLQAYGEEGFGA